MPVRRIQVTVGSGLATALVSLLMPISYDEGFWLAISRMMGNGAVLYETAIDNKSPVLYLFLQFLDLLPISFQAIRSVVVGSIVAALLWLMMKGPEDRAGRPSIAVAVLVTAMVVLLAAFRLQTELLAAPFVAAALGIGLKGRTLAGGVLAIIATSFSPLAAGTIPVVLYLSRRKSAPVQWRRGFLVTVFAALAIGGLVLSVDNLRYGVVELNLASRSSFSHLSAEADMLARFLQAALSLLPLFVLGWVQRWRGETVVLLGVIALPAVLAGLGFPHYWIVVTTAGGVLIGGTDRIGVRRLSQPSMGLVAMSLLPLALWTGLQYGPSERITDRYDGVAATLATIQGHDWTFVQADLQPFLAAEFPGRIDHLSPSINYLAWETSRSDEHRAHLRDVLETADVLIDPGLEDPRLRPVLELEPVLDIFRGRLDRFPCSVEVESVAIRVVESLCDDIER